MDNQQYEIKFNNLHNELNNIPSWNYLLLIILSK